MRQDTLMEKLLFTTVRIEAEGSVGTGFIFYHRINEEEAVPFLVTNKHVVDGRKSGTVTFIQGTENGKPKVGSVLPIAVTNFETAWIGHPDPAIDITVAPLGGFFNELKTKIYFQYISQANIPTVEQAEELDALEEIIFIGYPNGIWDTRNYLPIMRRGTTATPIEIDYEGEKKFLIDASVFGGSSGSPVFTYKHGTHIRRDGQVIITGLRCHFVGVVAAVYYREEHGEVITLPVPTSKNIAIGREMLDLGVVYKASTVLETVNFALKRLGIEPAPVP